MTSAPVLAARNVSRSYGPVVALRDVTMELYPGEVHALVGENGAGKSTLVRILCNVESPDSGSVSWSKDSPRSVSVVPQTPRFAPTLSVWRNLIVGMEPATGPILRRSQAIRTLESRAREFGLDLDLRQPAGTLNQSETRLAATLAAVTVDPAVLILDEPTVGLAQTDKDRLFETMKRLAASGRAVLFVSHNLEEVAEHADRITVISRAQIVATRKAPVRPAELTDLLFGRSGEGGRLASRTGGVGDESQPAPGSPPADGDAASRTGGVGGKAQPAPESPPAHADAASRTGAEELSAAARLEFAGLTVVDSRSGRTVGPLTATVRAGQTTAILGLRDAGIDILESFFSGQIASHRGALTVNGHRVPSRPKPTELRRLGLAFLPSDRMTRSASLAGSVEDNLIVVDRRRLHPGGVRHRTQIQEHTKGLLSRFDIAARTQNPLGELSGGTIQKLILGRELAAKPKVLILTSPSAGLDVASQERLKGELQALTRDGAAVVILSTELDEAQRLADTIWVLYNGQSCGAFAGTDRNEIASAMTGLVQGACVG